MKTLKRIIVRTRWEFHDVDMKFAVTEMKEARYTRDMINRGETEFSQCAKIVKVYTKATSSSMRVRCGCGDSYCNDCAGG